MDKRILFISHMLNNSGAPLVLMDMINICRSEGAYIEVVSLEDGPLKDVLEDEGIPVLIADNFLDHLEVWQKAFRGFDLVVANTLLCVEAIYVLNTTGVPTIWWIHEPEYWFEKYKPILPKPEDLRPNINIYGVSPITNDLIIRYGGYEPQLLPFGIMDRKADFAVDKKDEGKVRFILPATFSEVKGQNLLCEAINGLSEDVRSKCEFFLCGGTIDSEIDYYNKVLEWAEKYPCINVLGSIPHDEVLRLMAEDDYIIAPSLLEPFSATVVEGMMMGIVPVFSSACGVSHFLSDTVDCFIFQTGNVDAIKRVLEEMVELRLEKNDAYKTVANNARKSYERLFSMEVFRERIINIFNNL